MFDESHRDIKLGEYDISFGSSIDVICIIEMILSILFIIFILTLFLKWFINIITNGGCSSIARASDCGSEGCGMVPHHSPQNASVGKLAKPTDLESVV